MNRDQLLPAFVGQLLLQGVEPEKIYNAVSCIADLRLGESITGNDHLNRAFAFEQAKRLDNITD